MFTRRSRTMAIQSPLSRGEGRGERISSHVRSVLVLLALLATAVQAADRVLSGELVPLDGSSTRFRLVGHEGAFTAPPGTPLDALDGKAVVVELSADGTVTRITERLIAITPVTTGWESVRGQLAVRDAAAGTFGIVGATGVYTAPAGLDLRPYAGKWVEVTLDAEGRARRITLLADRPPPALPTPALAPLSGSGAARRRCAIGDATVASGSSICRAGVTQRCEDGTWLSLGTPCW